MVLISLADQESAPLPFPSDRVKAEAILAGLEELGPAVNAKGARLRRSLRALVK